MIQERLRYDTKDNTHHLTGDFHFDVFIYAVD